MVRPHPGSGRSPADPRAAAWAIGRPVDDRVVVNNERPVARSAHVEFHAVDTEVDRRAKGAERVFSDGTMSAAVSKDSVTPQV